MSFNEENHELFDDIQFQETVEEIETEEIEEVEENEAEEKVEEAKEENKEKPKDKIHQALDSERARRKKAEAELREYKSRKAEDERVTAEKQALIDKLVNGKSELHQDVAEDIVGALGDELIRQRIKSEDYEFKKKLTELQREEIFYDADEYENEIQDFMKKTGVDIETAYFAVAGKNKFTKNSKEIESAIEQKLLAKRKRAEKGYIDNTTATQDEREKYTEKEKNYAKLLGLDTKDVRARSNASSLDEILKL